MKCSSCSAPIGPKNASGLCKVCNIRAARARRRVESEGFLDWLPEEWREDYFHWTHRLKMPADEAKRIILDHVRIRGRA